MMFRLPLVLLAAAVLVLLPATSVTGQDAGSTAAVTFYGHVFGSGYAAPMPANTEKPIGENNFGLGSFDWCTPQGNFAGVPPTPGDGTDCNDDPLNKLALFSTAGFVDVKDLSEFNQQGGYAQLHNERGQTKDIVLDTSQSIAASIYLSLDLHAWPVAGQPFGTNCIYNHPPDVPCVYPYWGWDPGVQKDFVVEATLYSANLGEHGSSASEAPPIADALAAGPAVIAQGRAGPGDVINGIPGYANVNEFVVDLGPPLVDTIPRDHDFFIVYSFYSETAGTQFGLHTWRIWSGELFPPSFTLPVKNAFDVERVIPNFAHGKLALLGVMNTPWGSYDIAPESVELTVMRGNQEVFPEHIQRFGEFSVAHGGHYLPINITWIWDYNADGVQPGDYEVTVSASNFQHSAEAACTATFELRAGRGGGLVAGEVSEGICGIQSASEEFLEQITEGSTTGGS